MYTWDANYKGLQYAAKGLALLFVLFQPNTAEMIDTFAYYVTRRSIN